MLIIYPDYMKAWLSQY